MAVRRVARRVSVQEKPDVEVQYVSIDDLVPWEDNPRSNDVAAVELAKLMDEHGFVNPVVAWGNVVYAGCTRLKAARLRGIERVPVIQGNFRDKIQAVAFALADNRSAEIATWDEDRLAKILKGDLAEVDVGKLECMTGFKQDEIKGIREGIQEPEPIPESREPTEVVHQCPNCGHEWV